MEQERQQNKPVKFNLWPGQKLMLEDTKFPRHCLSAGVGYGKTHFAVPWFFSRCIANKNSEKSAIFAPTNQLLKEVNFAFFVKFLKQAGWIEKKHYKLNMSPGSMSIDLFFGHRIHFFTAQNWKTILGYTISHFWIDEPGWLPSEVSHYVDERLRCPNAVMLQGLETGVSQGDTPYLRRWTGPEFLPEGSFTVPDGREFPRYRMAYAEDGRPTKLLMHGSSYENTLLPQGFFDGLQEAYGWNRRLFDAHVHGQMFAFNEEAVYFEYDPAIHIIDHDIDIDNDTLYIGLDFNPGQCTWVAVQEDAGRYIVVADNGSSARIVDEACEQFKKAFPPELWRRHDIVIYGDASGYHPSDRAYGTSYDVVRDLLKPHYPRLKIKARRSNPTITTRITTTNRLFAKKRLFASKQATKIAQGWGITSWDKNGGIKKQGAKDTHTHAPDACDYILLNLEPIILNRGGGVTY